MIMIGASVALVAIGCASTPHPQTRAHRAAKQTPAQHARTCSTAPPPTGATGSGWSLAHYDFHHTYLDMAATPSGSLWVVGRYWPEVCGRTTDQPLVLRGDGKGEWTRVPAPELPDSFASRIAAVSDDDVWLFGDSGQAHWNGSTWTVTSSDGARFGRPYTDAKNIWIIEGANILSGAGGAESGPWQAMGVLRRWNGSTWRKEWTPVTPASVSDGWIAGSSHRNAALARRSGGVWRAVPIPAVPTVHKGQFSRLEDVTVDASGRVSAIGWIAWVCGGEEEDVDYCGRGLFLHGVPGRWSYTLRDDPSFDAYGPIEADPAGGVWILYSKNDFVESYVRVMGTKWTFGDFPRGPLGNTRIGHLVSVRATGAMWAAGSDATEAEEPPYKGGAIWRWAP
ncbi:hypothetical protein J5X84_38000 [Streptosporangiaceae bacterium NEAU-GS5]|nr:hypothetical protein [Streptosporangiaceae bacterium NEAU-GS5]